MHDGFSIRPWHSTEFFGPEGFFVELDGLAGSFDYQVWRQRVKATGNWFDSAAHVFPFFVFFSLVRNAHLRVIALELSPLVGPCISKMCLLHNVLCLSADGFGHFSNTT